MSNFLKSFFFGKQDSQTDEKQKNNQKNFEIFKYDGIRAQRMGRADYAEKCFREALAINEDFETMGYLSQLYIQIGEYTKAIELLERMADLEPHMASTFLTLANVYFLQENYEAMESAAQKAISADENDPTAYILLAKSCKGLGNHLMVVAHLTKAISLKEDSIEARLMRADILIEMGQFKEASDDISYILSQNPNEETALLLRGKVKEAEADEEGAEADYQLVTEINPFNEQAYLYRGKLLIVQKKLEDAISIFDEAIELNPNFAEAYKERGKAKLLNGDKEGSVNDMKKSLELNPKEGVALNGQFNNQESHTTNILGI